MQKSLSINNIKLNGRLTSLGETAAAEASNVDGGGDNDDEELDAIRREGS